jgi:hypothetical protein
MLSNIKKFLLILKYRNLNASLNNNKDLYINLKPWAFIFLLEYIYISISVAFFCAIKERELWPLETP